MRALLRTKPAAKRTLRDRLARLDHTEAVRLLGRDGEQLLRARQSHQIAIPADVEFNGEHLEVCLRAPRSDGDERDQATRRLIARVRVSLVAGNQLRWWCSDCPIACEHVGAVFSLVLNEKLALGLSVAPNPKRPLELLSESELADREITARQAAARLERMSLKTLESSATPWTDYAITNHATGQSYRLAMRGHTPNAGNYCSCADFRNNGLGLCIHTEFALNEFRAHIGNSHELLDRPVADKPRVSVGLSYATGHGTNRSPTLSIRACGNLPPSLRRLTRPHINGFGNGKGGVGSCSDDPNGNARRTGPSNNEDALRRVEEIHSLGVPVRVFPDAARWIDRRMFANKASSLVAEIRRDPARHPLRRTLLKVELLPYQLEGIAFVIAAGRAVLADEMGLGKTIQAIGAAELFARIGGAKKVLIVSPASVKAQWKREIERFSTRSVQIVEGPAATRCAQYGADSFFSICNYEQVLRDLTPIQTAKWDLLVLDEAQRIKNAGTKTAAAIKRIRSRFALALTGTPIENRLDDLHSILEFVDNRVLGPAFRLRHRHRVVSENGELIAYTKLAELRAAIAPVLLRRTRAEVASSLPQLITHTLVVPATAEQQRLDRGYRRRIMELCKKFPLTEEDLRQLQQLLLLSRLAADASSLVHKDGPTCSGKLNALRKLLAKLGPDSRKKILIFSEWTSMLALIEKQLGELGLGWVRLDGSIPQARRQSLVDRFGGDPSCRAFLTTNAGSTGLNLQAANTVINIDLPWNPAVLAQRIGRAYRLGQTDSVTAYILVTESSIESRLLGTLEQKSALFEAVLNRQSNVDSVACPSAAEAFKRKLEVLGGAESDAPVSEEERRQIHCQAERLARSSQPEGRQWEG